MPSEPFSVTADCPAETCDLDLRVRWPTDNPESVRVECLCGTFARVHRDGSAKQTSD